MQSTVLSLMDLSFIMWGGGGIKTTCNDYNGKQKNMRAAI